MTNQTKKELALVVTVLASIFGAPKLAQDEENALLSSMHEEILTLSGKVTDLKKADSVLLISYNQVASAVDSLVMRARVEDRIRIELQRQNKQLATTRVTSYAEAQKQAEGNQSTTRPNDSWSEEVLNDWE